MLSPKREGRITGSVFASAMGIGYDSRQKLWRTIKGLEPKFEGNAATEWGSEHEKDAIDQYEIETGHIVTNGGDKQQFVISKEYDWLGCTPDGEVGDIVIEAKCPASLNLYGKVPDHYMAQVQGQMFICEKPKCHFVVWTPLDFEVYEVHRSEEYIKQMLDLLKEFKEYIDSDTEPKRRKKPVLPEVTYRKIIGETNATTY